MNRKRLILLLLVLCSGCAAEDDSTARIVKLDDPEMKAAMAEARRTLPEFYAVLDEPKRRDGISGLALKVELSDANGTELLWLNGIHRKEEDGNKTLVGTVNNQPHVIRFVSQGERIDIDEQKIRDWLYVRDDKIQGNYTIRPLLKHLPKEEAEKLHPRLAPVTIQPTAAEAPAP